MENRHKAHISIGLQNDFNKFEEYNEYLRNQDLVYEPHIIDITNMSEDRVFEQVVRLLSEEKFI